MKIRVCELQEGDFMKINGRCERVESVESINPRFWIVTLGGRDYRNDLYYKMTLIESPNKMIEIMNRNEIHKWERLAKKKHETD